MSDTKAMARAERAELVDFLATLTPEEWEAPTLCARWRVRDVVAHVFDYDSLGVGGTVRRLVKGGVAGNQAGVDEARARTPAELLAVARERVSPHGLPAAFGARIALTDGLVHHQDIRRPLGRPREIPPERLVAVLGFARIAPPIGAAKRVRGLRLRATDVDWAAGEGPVVEGPAEPLLMAMAGRAGAVEQLSGAGVATLASRL
ncbi:maleylpyruvate isomerase family mycothiol-dependent enzyme [Actinokineospora bangkokensis]|uniref:DinB family protein n=1 Tax=Actinokineospora bangkokensis TaxID=1193682 RepID=A0A1Q9LN51_9PSEU|nr:maleylpyruvate isomerase family mycothiol-dependent enzyme [Actinokineospora bangkokensis]OLR93476.1 DinB family protein [Actinokineospora bangkokensis]